MARYTVDEIESRADRAVRAVALSGLSTLVLALAMAFYPPFAERGEARWLVWTYGALLLVAGVCWVLWFRALWEPVVAAGRARFGPSMWFWGWVVPGLTPFAGKWLTEDVWRAPDPPNAPTEPPPAVRRWWLLWVTAGVAPYVMRVIQLDRQLMVIVLLGVYVVMTPYAIRTIRLLTPRVALLRSVSAG